MRANTFAVADVPAQLGVVHVFERLAGYHATRVQTRLARDRRRGRGVVACDHDDPDAGGPTFPHRRGRALAQRIGEADESDEFERECARRRRQLPVLADGSRDAENPQPVGRHFADRSFQGVEARAVETAEFRDRFGRAFRGDHELRSAGRWPPDLRHGEQIGAQAIGMNEFETAAVRPLRIWRALTAQFVKGSFHGIERFARAGQDADPDQVEKPAGERGVRGAVETKRLAVGAPQLRDRHPILGQRAGLVRAQNRRGAEGFDGGGAPRQNARARNAPGSHRHEDGQHNRKLLGKHRHPERDAAQQSVEPMAA